MLWGFLFTFILLVGMLVWCLLEVRRVDRVTRDVDQRLGEQEPASEESNRETG